MIKLSESRLREIIAEELEAVQDDTVAMDDEKVRRIADLNAEIDEKMAALEKLMDEKGLDESIFDMASSAVDTAKTFGSLGGGVVSRFTKGSNITKAIQQYAKESLIRWVFTKMGLKDGVPKELLTSFFEELEFNEIRRFLDKPQCSIFVDQMFDTLLDFGLDSLRPTIDSVTNKINSIPLLKVIMRSSPGNDIMTKLLSGVGTEAIQNFIKTDPASKAWIEENMLIGVCNVWDNVWKNIDVEDGLIDLNAALDKAYPDEFSSSDSLI